MAKIRSKLTRHGKGKVWSKGHSSTSNPEQMKHRIKAKSRFFQPLVATEHSTNSSNTLTLDALQQHDQRQSYTAEATINDVAGSLKSFNLNDNDDEQFSDSQHGTFSTIKSFASVYSACSNMSFKKIINGFRGSSELHKEMLAILTALTEIIKERGGTESSTEYFLLLMKQIEGTTDENGLTAGISLLDMGIKSVPTPVLRKEFDTTAKTLLNLLKQYAESANQTLLKHVIGCLSVLLRAQDYTNWTYSSIWPYVDGILSFTLHIKPKIRKAAQHAIVSIVQGSSFMATKADADENSNNSANVNLAVSQFHPAGSRITQFCLIQFKPDQLTNSQSTVLYTLTLLKDVISRFKTEDIRTLCENLLSIMTAPNVIIRTSCFNVLHSLFVSRNANLDKTLCAKLLGALYEYMPDRADIRQTIAWATVLKEGHIHLAYLDLTTCMNVLPHLFDVYALDLWMSDRAEITTCVFNIIKELFLECVQKATSSKKNADIHKIPITRIITAMNKVLSAPFGSVTKLVILAFATVFDVCGEHFKSELAPSLLNLAKRYDTESALRVQIEYAIIAAIKAMGPETVLKILPLTNSKSEVMVEKSWILPLLREGIQQATFKFFKDNILPLALDCNTKWHKCAKNEQLAMSHTYELLCCQLWGLFPGFCRQPKDPENFCLIAPTIGNALDNNPEFHTPIFDGLIELIQNNESPELHEALGKYSKNFLPRLFNIYTKKPTTTYESDLHNRTLEVIKLYLAETPEDTLKEMFTSAQAQLSATTSGSFEYFAIFDITASLALYQTSETIREFFESYVAPVLKNEKSNHVVKDEQKLKKQQRKTYELLRELLTSERASCKKFSRKNGIAIHKLFSETFTTSCTICQAERLQCLKALLENRKSLTTNDKIVMKTIPEAVLSYKEFSTRKENVAEEIIKFIADLYQKADKLNEFIDILTAGFVGDESLITNTILVFRTVIQYQGANMTISSLEFILQQIAVFIVQKSRGEAEASIVFLITFIKILPTPLIANHLETIMKSLSAMMKDTKRYCRIQIGYLLKKLCKRFNVIDLKKFVPGDDEVTHKRLKKIQKQMRRDIRKKINNDKDKDAEDDSDIDELNDGLEKKSETVDDILADTDSDLSEDEDEKNEKKSKTKKKQNTFIREDPEDIVDLADIKSIGNVLTNHPGLSSNKMEVARTKSKDSNRGFKTSSDGRLIISDKALIGESSDDEDEEKDEAALKTTVKQGMEVDSSDEEDVPQIKRKRQASGSAYNLSAGKGIHRKLNSDAVSVKSNFSTTTTKSAKNVEYTSKKAKGDMKKKGQLDPYAYLPLSKNTLNKRKRGNGSGAFKSVISRKGPLKGVKTRIKKTYKK